MPSFTRVITSQKNVTGLPFTRLRSGERGFIEAKDENDALSKLAARDKAINEINKKYGVYYENSFQNIQQK